MARSMLQAPELPPVSDLSRYLVNDLDKIEDPYILVLDDFHKIRAKTVHDLMGGLLSRQFYEHAYFARPDEPLEIAKDAWEQTLRLYKRNQLLSEITAAETRLAESMHAVWPVQTHCVRSTKMPAGSFSRNGRCRNGDE